MDLLVGAESSPTEVSDKIKELLFAKSAEKIDAYRPSVSDSMFSNEESVEDAEEEITPDEE